MTADGARVIADALMGPGMLAAGAVHTVSWTDAGDYFLSTEATAAAAASVAGAAAATASASASASEAAYAMHAAPYPMLDQPFEHHPPEHAVDEHHAHQPHTQHHHQQLQEQHRRRDHQRLVHRQQQHHPPPPQPRQPRQPQQPQQQQQHSGGGMLMAQSAALFSPSVAAGATNALTADHSSHSSLFAQTHAPPQQMQSRRALDRDAFGDPLPVLYPQSTAASPLPMFDGAASGDAPLMDVSWAGDDAATARFHMSLLNSRPTVLEAPSPSPARPIVSRSFAALTTSEAHDAPTSSRPGERRAAAEEHEPHDDIAPRQRSGSLRAGATASSNSGARALDSNQRTGASQWANAQVAMPAQTIVVGSFGALIGPVVDAADTGTQAEVSAHESSSATPLPTRRPAAKRRRRPRAKRLSTEQRVGADSSGGPHQRRKHAAGAHGAAERSASAVAPVSGSSAQSYIAAGPSWRVTWTTQVDASGAVTTRRTRDSVLKAPADRASRQSSAQVSLRDCSSSQTSASDADSPCRQGGAALADGGAHVRVRRSRAPRDVSVVPSATAASSHRSVSPESFSAADAVLRLSVAAARASADGQRGLPRGLPAASPEPPHAASTSVVASAGAGGALPPIDVSVLRGDGLFVVGMPALVHVDLSPSTASVPLGRTTVPLPRAAVLPSENRSFLRSMFLELVRGCALLERPARVGETAQSEVEAATAASIARQFVFYYMTDWRVYTGFPRRLLASDRRARWLWVALSACLGFPLERAVTVVYEAISTVRSARFDPRTVQRPDARAPASPASFWPRAFAVFQLPKLAATPTSAGTSSSLWDAELGVLRSVQARAAAPPDQGH